MFEIKHLKTMAALADTGNLRKAADKLFSSQSALSHQIKDLESRLSSPLFIRNSSPIEFTETGKVLLALATDILPKIEQTKQQLKAPSKQKQSLRLAVACHACFQWLLPVINNFSPSNTNNITDDSAYNNSYNIEFIDENFPRITTQSSTKMSSSISHQQENDQSVDILFTDERHNDDTFVYHEIGQFEVVAVSSKQQQLNPQHSYLNAQDFQQLTLLTYPLPITELDIFKLFLTPAKVTPAKVKQVNNSHIMLQMVAANMGVATLPDWLVSSQAQQSLLQGYRLGEHGVFKTLYARYQVNNSQVTIIEQLIPQAMQAFAQLYANNE
ncbi:LysR family transcriptional regulator [Colwellia sp. D2M02]|uniref:LysR substrate-binding domain-containing protein n=1 Tax=Colwellia sp. D2M02 TaxID=2841562 RepID=UPI001C091B71|nr:LysR substrate-binding domain-containing protein [Colwellia sp. D2M02]MBU2893615.1 LysR family transcriptional regulator [Colwellia sp. D2M02]